MDHKAKSALQEVRRKVAADGREAADALVEVAFPFLEYNRALNALHKSIPLRWRIKSGNWSSNERKRRLDIRNYCLSLDRADVLALIDCAVERVSR